MQTKNEHPLPVTEMSIRELEEELSMLELALTIFHGSAPGETITLSEALQIASNRYADRVRDIKNEIFERQVLVKS